MKSFASNYYLGITIKMSSSTRRATISNEEQLWLMSQVKQSIMTIDEAVSWTENRENELRSMEDEVITHKVITTFHFLFASEHGNFNILLFFDKYEIKSLAKNIINTETQAIDAVNCEVCADHVCGSRVRIHFSCFVI